MIRRREFISLLGGTATAWPLTARAQQPLVRRIAILMYGDDDTIVRASASMRNELTRLGWVDGRNLRTDLRFVGPNAGAITAAVDDAVKLDPEVIVAHTGPMTRVVQQKTQKIPIVLMTVGDPVANGYVQSISRPEANTTGITNLFFSVAGKWAELLKDAVPRLQRVGYVYGSVFNMAGYWGAI